MPSTGRWCCLFFGLPVLVLIVARLALRSSSALRLRVAVEVLGWDGIAEVAREAIGTRILGPRDTASRREWRRLLEALAEADEKYLSPTGRAVVEPDDIAEGHRFLSHLLRTGFETQVELDASRPAFRPFVAADRKLLGDNPDALYFAANLDPSHAYLVRGRKTAEDYFSLAVYAAPCEGCFIREAVSDINDRNLTLGPDGAFDVLVSASRPEGYTGNWLSLGTDPDDAAAGGAAPPLPQKATEEVDADGVVARRGLQLVTRHYYEREVSVLGDTQFPPPTLSIFLAEPETGKVVASPPPPVPTDAAMARSLRAVRRFVEQHSTEFDSDPLKAPSWFSFTPNHFGAPTVSRDGDNEKMGAVDLAYAAGPFKLKPDEALVVEGVMPPCAFANVVLWNRYLQSFESVGRQTSLNRKQMKIAKDGYFKIVIAHQNPGEERASNWLDTMGRPGGTVFWRFVLPEGPIRPINATVLNVHRL